MSDVNPPAHHRRRTPLAKKLTDIIRADGPISVARYMDLCLTDPEHGYYRHRQAIGASGDFVTAPEISQVFGELIGLWSAIVWQRMGSPSPFNLVEYGPGRGTLMADALRAARRVPGFLEAACVRLIEINPLLRDLQRAALAPSGAAVTWHRQVAGDCEALPTISIANEFIDTQPIEQRYVLEGRAWTRGVGLDAAGDLEFCLLVTDDGAVPPVEAPLFESRDFHPVLAADLAAMPATAALLIDYGHVESNSGDTLQAVREHRYEHPLGSPGEADLTAQVDFAAFSRQAHATGLIVDGPATQAAFLGALGAAERASRLMAANTGRAAEIEAGVARLLSPGGMGGRFKVIGLRSPHVPELPGLAPPQS